MIGKHYLHTKSTIDLTRIVHPILVVASDDVRTTQRADQNTPFPALFVAPSTVMFLVVRGAWHAWEGWCAFPQRGRGVMVSSDGSLVVSVDVVIVSVADGDVQGVTAG